MGKTNSFEEVKVKCIGESQNDQSIVEISIGNKIQLFEALVPGEWVCRILGPCEPGSVKTRYKGSFYLCKSRSYYLEKQRDSTCKKRLSLEDYLKQIGYL